MTKIQEVSACGWRKKMMDMGASPTRIVNAESVASYANTGYAAVKVGNKVIGIVTRYDHDNPRYFVDFAFTEKAWIQNISSKYACAAIEMVI